MNENKANVQTIAFYLPQFHTIPENDKAHGMGFTEWTNTKKAIPLFEGHYQPKTPLNENYYCLLDEGVMASQAKLAKEYGIYGFCYYHYWFKDGKKLLEKPIEMMLKDRSIDIPFCLCWANENWSRRWDGGNNEIIVEQDYGNLDDLKNHIDYLCEFFKDDRYITIDNQPLLLIYKPELIPNLKCVVKTIRSEVRKHGFSGVKLAVQYPKYYSEDARLRLFDYYIQFQPVTVYDREIESKRSWWYKQIRKTMTVLGLRKIGKRIHDVRKQSDEYNTLRIRNYDDDWETILNWNVKDKRLMAGAFTDWDNTARNKNGTVYKGGSPEKFEKYMTRLVRKVKNEYKSNFIFINAWNEWAEGAYLEPDEKYGYSYLEALKNALNAESE